MLTLYYHTGACSLAPHIALEWIGEPYETKAIKFGDKEYLKINPAGAVPALDTGEGWILTQAAAVLRYLADRFPQAGIAPDGSPRDEAEADRWSSFITGDKLSYLDAYVFPMERWGASLLEDGLSKYPNVQKHHDMMAADEGVKRALAAEGA